MIAGAGYLVYPWTGATALDKHQIVERHAREVARILANMHRADIVVPHLADAQFEYQTPEKIIALVNRALECNLLHARALSEQLPAFLRIAVAHSEAIRILEKNLVLSHGDVDHKNVLWSIGGGPLLIDWESSRRLNATYEIMLESLDWSGITATFQQDLFRSMLAAYTRSGGVIDGDSIEASFQCILGDWLNWLLFNVGRGAERADAQERAMILESMETIERAVGRMPAGYLAPALSHSEMTVDLFAELGGRYTCDLFHDDQPTPVKVRGGQRFVSVPYSLELNDTIVYVVNKIEPRRYGQIIKDAFDRLYAEGANSGTVMCLPTHNYQVSCPHRMKAFEEALEYITGHADV